MINIQLGYFNSASYTSQTAVSPLNVIMYFNLGSLRQSFSEVRCRHTYLGESSPQRHRSFYKFTPSLAREEFFLITRTHHILLVLPLSLSALLDNQ